MVSIIICTRNRAESLKRTLESVWKSAPSWEVDWELLVVDNGSTDHTRAVVTDFLEGSSFDIRLLHEPRTGKSYALNFGIRHARGECILFTDDDALVTPLWLPEMCRTFEIHESIGIVGGQTQSLDATQVKQGVRDSLEPRDYRWPTSSAFVVGNNMGIRKAALDVVGGFDTHLGAGSRVGGAEETDIAYRILKAGYSGRYVPEALVYHDHRRDDGQIQKIRLNYAKGRGAFFIKHMLHGDAYALKMAYWNTRTIINNRNHPDPSRCVKDWKRLLLAEWAGAIAWLARL